jgi:hypothetical protein
LFLIAICKLCYYDEFYNLNMKYLPEDSNIADSISDASSIRRILGSDCVTWAMTSWTDESSDGFLIWWHYWEVMEKLGVRIRLKEIGPGDYAFSFLLAVSLSLLPSHHEVSFTLHMCLPWCSVLPQAYSNGTQSAVGWNFSNEKKIFPPLRC